MEILMSYIKPLKSILPFAILKYNSVALGIL